MATAEAIKDAGFEVVEASDADAAIVILESYTRRIRQGD
jgi:hypothetical protein